MFGHAGTVLDPARQRTVAAADEFHLVGFLDNLFAGIDVRNQIGAVVVAGCNLAIACLALMPRIF